MPSRRGSARLTPLSTKRPSCAERPRSAAPDAAIWAAEIDARGARFCALGSWVGSSVAVTCVGALVSASSIGVAMPTRLARPLCSATLTWPPALDPPPPAASSRPSSSICPLPLKLMLPPALLTVCRCVTLPLGPSSDTSSRPALPLASMTPPACQIRLERRVLAMDRLTEPPSSTRPRSSPSLPGVRSRVPATSRRLSAPSQRNWGTRVLLLPTVPAVNAIRPPGARAWPSK